MVATDVILIPVCTKPGVKHFKPMKIAYFLYWPFKYGCQLIISPTALFPCLAGCLCFSLPCLSSPCLLPYPAYFLDLPISSPDAFFCAFIFFGFIYYSLYFLFYFFLFYFYFSFTDFFSLIH